MRFPLILSEILHGSKQRGMVYLLADWGMGESELRTSISRLNATTATVTTTLSAAHNNHLHHHQQLLSAAGTTSSTTTTTTTGHHDDLNEVDLHPLSNQVGGHTRLMVLNPNTICKPLNYRELEFYQNIQDQDIKMFVPKYKGKQSIDFSPLFFFIKSLIIS